MLCSEQQALPIARVETRPQPCEADPIRRAAWQWRRRSAKRRNRWPLADHVQGRHRESLARTTAHVVSAVGSDREKAMDWDDLKPKAPKGICLGESLESLSVAELDARIVALDQEIERVRAELARKKAHETAAAAIFKR